MTDTVEELAAAVRSGDRAALPRAITLLESTRADHREQAQQLLLALMPDAGNAHRVGITGTPGAGKSTAIEALGMQLIDQRHRVAVLAVDPSSTRTGGVGQSEVAVANMVDTFVLLTLARAGDQLQGIKKGVLELADIVVVNKADGEHLVEARLAARELSAALRLIYPHETLWRPPVLTMSSIEGTGLTELWDTTERHCQVLTEAGEFDERRRAQQVDWTWQMVRDTVLDRVLSNPDVLKIQADVERQVRAGELTPALAAQQILNAASR